MNLRRLERQIRAHWAKVGVHTIVGRFLITVKFTTDMSIRIKKKTLGETMGFPNCLAATPGEIGIDSYHKGPGECSLSRQANHEPPPRALLTELYVPLMFAPIEPMIETSPTVIKPNITAYSVAVGPSSLVRNRLMREEILFIGHSLSEQMLDL
jgi:hypothetical protein